MSATVSIAPRVLVADDEPILRAALSELLTDEGFVVAGQACNGREAIDMARELEPDLVIMDVRMPVLGGIEATHVITSEMPDMRVVMLSAYEDPALEQMSRAAHACAYLVKGCSPSYALDVIRKVCEGRTFSRRS